MLQQDDAQLLARWCRRRRVRFQDRAGGVDLEVQRPLHLQSGPAGFRLHDGVVAVPGRMLAEASDLRAVLDALDGGVAEPGYEADGCEVVSNTVESEIT